MRYITRANERYQLRAALYQLAVDMLAGKEAATSTPSTPLTAGKIDAALPELTRPKS